MTLDEPREARGSENASRALERDAEILDGGAASRADVEGR
jgi:hypothetical protein